MNPQWIGITLALLTSIHFSYASEAEFNHLLTQSALIEAQEIQSASFHYSREITPKKKRSLAIVSEHKERFDIYIQEPNHHKVEVYSLAGNWVSTFRLKGLTHYQIPFAQAGSYMIFIHATSGKAHIEKVKL